MGWAGLAFPLSGAKWRDGETTSRPGLLTPHGAPGSSNFGGDSVPSFTGEFHHSIDAKGRLIVPARLRPALDGDQVVLSRWLDGGIAMWSASGWDDIETRLRAQGRGSTAARTLLRIVASSAYQDTIDKQGRISVPQQLRDAAGIDREVVVIGALDHAEIWQPERWDDLKQTAVEPGQLEELTEQLTDF